MLLYHFYTFNMFIPLNDEYRCGYIQFLKLNKKTTYRTRCSYLFCQTFLFLEKVVIGLIYTAI